ncbi:MAG TPA: two-component system response regulator [Candidatus Marinimicrobia bacterium]|nr:MAG: two-component system response regulator [Candidatus Marinimicrobia bacterium CG_4_9_14_3_um_filter_48_9]HCW76969.1 two-component system response regulator [Candidatus Neomarinimicrobiota bacterium]
MRILIVDDEQIQRDSLAGFLKHAGHQVFMADSGGNALALLQQELVEVVLTDYKMPGMTGAQLLHDIRRRYPNIVVLLITAFGTIETAVNAMKAGAWDFLTKPIDLDILENQLKAIASFFKEQTQTKSKLTPFVTGEFVAVDEQMVKLFQQAERLAQSNATVLITGETGTGKEVLAQFIHTHSPRKKNPFIAVNSAALPGNLVESELFGHEKGAFTGAAAQRIGRFEEADKGTLFLDEIGDLPPDVQVKLLRFLQEGEIQRVGGNKTIKTDTRVISATNVDLKQAVFGGTFREDLYYRINVVRIQIPALRDRRRDIIPLAEFFSQKVAQRERLSPVALTESAKQALLTYAFPGNIRELQNLMERAVLLTDSGQIDTLDLAFEQPLAAVPASENLPDYLATLERDLIMTTLTASNGNQSECARRLGISERVLRYKLGKYGVR